MRRRHRISLWGARSTNLAWGLTLLVWGVLVPPDGVLSQEESPSQALERIRPISAGTGFLQAESERPFVAWGVNYDHDEAGKLLEDYWHDDWDRVVKDFGEIKMLGANVVRIHLQLARFMAGPEKTNAKNLEQLARLVDLAGKTGLYLDITGLGCYRKPDVPAWYTELGETDRWKVQARFWESIARTCADSPAIFCYDLMNEPILPGAARKEDNWLAGEFGGYWFVQRIALELRGRTRKEVAMAWVSALSDAIRKHDKRAMITVGVIPWAHTFPGAKPLFYSPEVSGPLDFVSVHFYPRKDGIKEALEALAVYEIGKPLVIEETFPLHCSATELLQFIDQSRTSADGWISFYWGRTADEYDKDATKLAGAIKADWLRKFKAKSPDILGTSTSAGQKR